MFDIAEGREGVLRTQPSSVVVPSDGWPGDPNHAAARAERDRAERRERIAEMSVARRFPYAFAGAYRAPAGVFGTVSRNSWVELRDHEMVARFGLWGLRTPYANIATIE